MKSWISPTLGDMLLISEGSSIKPVTELLPEEKGPVNVVLPGTLRRDLSRVALKSNHSMSSLVVEILQQVIQTDLSVLMDDGKVIWA